MTENESIDVALQQPASKWSIYKTYLRYGMMGNWIGLTVFLIIIPLMFYNWWQTSSDFRLVPVVPFGSYMLLLVASFCIPLFIWSDLPPSKRSYLLLSLDGSSALWLKVATGLLMHLLVVATFLSMVLVTTLLFPSQLTVGGGSGFTAFLVLTVIASVTVYMFQSIMLILVEHPARWAIGIFVLYIVVVRILGSSTTELPFDALHYIRAVIASIFDVLLYPLSYFGYLKSEAGFSKVFNEFPRQLVISSMWLVISLILLAGTISYRSKER